MPTKLRAATLKPKKIRRIASVSSSPSPRKSERWPRCSKSLRYVCFITYLIKNELCGCKLSRFFFLILFCFSYSIDLVFCRIQKQIKSLQLQVDHMTTSIFSSNLVQNVFNLIYSIMIKDTSFASNTGEHINCFSYSYGQG